jgi:hypothetical protein
MKKPTLEFSDFISNAFNLGERQKAAKTITF